MFEDLTYSLATLEEDSLASTGQLISLISVWKHRYAKPYLAREKAEAEKRNQPDPWHRQHVAFERASRLVWLNEVLQETSRWSEHFRLQSSKQLTRAEVLTIIDWLRGPQAGVLLDRIRDVTTWLWLNEEDIQAFMRGEEVTSV